MIKTYTDRYGYSVEETDDFLLFKNEFGELELGKYKGNASVVSVPVGVNVISIDSFNGTPVEEILLPDSVQIINSRAFMNCNCLKTIHIPESVIRIHDHAFDGCKILQDITMPKHLDFLGQYAFRDTGLKTAIFPMGIKLIIGGPVYVSCPNLEVAVVVESEMKLNTGEFSKCEKLRDFYYDGPIDSLPPVLRLKIEMGKGITCHSIQTIEALYSIQNSEIKGH